MTPYYDEDGVTIWHADYRDVMGHLEADVMVTDPPYGIKYRSGRSSPLFGKVAEEYQSAAGDAIDGDGDTSLRDDQARRTEAARGPTATLPPHAVRSARVTAADSIRSALTGTPAGAS